MPGTKRKQGAKGRPTGAKKGAAIRLAGDLTVGRASELHEAMLKALASGGRVTLSFGEVSRVDLAFLQLLFSLSKSARKAGRPLVVAPPGIPGPVAEAAVEAGFPPFEGGDL